MTVEQRDTIDLVAYDNGARLVVLVLVEERPWGECGLLLPDLESKLNGYLNYVTSGQLIADYPKLSGEPVRIELRCANPPGKREVEFLDIVVRNHFRPEKIDFNWRRIGEALKGPKLRF